MPNDELNPNDEVQNATGGLIEFRHLRFVIHSAFGIRHSTF